MDVQAPPWRDRRSSHDPDHAQRLRSGVSASHGRAISRSTRSTGSTSSRMFSTAPLAFPTPTRGCRCSSIRARSPTPATGNKGSNFAHYQAIDDLLTQRRQERIRKKGVALPRGAAPDHARRGVPAHQRGAERVGPQRQAREHAVRSRIRRGSATSMASRLCDATRGEAESMRSATACARSSGRRSPG